MNRRLWWGWLGFKLISPKAIPLFPPGVSSWRCQLNVWHLSDALMIWWPKSHCFNFGSSDLLEHLHLPGIMQAEGIQMRMMFLSASQDHGFYHCHETMIAERQPACYFGMQSAVSWKLCNNPKKSHPRARIFSRTFTLEVIQRRLHWLVQNKRGFRCRLAKTSQVRILLTSKPNYVQCNCDHPWL